MIPFWIFILLLIVGCAATYFIAFKKYTSQITTINNSIQKIVSGPVDGQKSGADLNDAVAEIEKLLEQIVLERRREIDKLKNADSYRREFLSNVSHELRTPVFNIQGYVSTLMDGGIDDPDVNHVYLSKASQSLDRLIALIDDLESLSRIESGELEMEMRTFDILELARDVTEELSRFANENSIQIQIENTTDDKFYIYADKDLIHQVFVNLIINSIKYGKENGTTVINVSRNGDKILLKISDNGIGISAQHLPRLFERFYRVDKHRARIKGGSGLGLAIVKHIIEAHNATINVESVPNEGTTFSCAFTAST